MIFKTSSSRPSHGFAPLSPADPQHNSLSTHPLGSHCFRLLPYLGVVLTTGKSRKEECPLCEENVEKPCVVPANKEVGILRSMKQAPEFVASVRQEMKLVHRPSWHEVRSTTVIVVAFFLLFLLYFYLLDRIFSPVYRWLYLR